MSMTLETEVEFQTFMEQFHEYQRLSKLTPVQAVEKQARELRVRFVQEFKKAAPSAEKIRQLPQFLHGKLKVRKQFLDEAEQANAGLFFRRDQGVERTRTGKVRSIQRRVSRNYRRAFEREIGARVRAINYLAATWVNEEHRSEKKPRTATFNAHSPSQGVMSQVRITTEGDSPEIILRNFVQAVAQIGYGRGIIANGLASASANMNEYITRKQSELNAAANSQ